MGFSRLIITSFGKDILTIVNIPLLQKNCQAGVKFLGYNRMEYEAEKAGFSGGVFVAQAEIDHFTAFAVKIEAFFFAAGESTGGIGAAPIIAGTAAAAEAGRNIGWQIRISSIKKFAAMRRERFFLLPVALTFFRFVVKYSDMTDLSGAYTDLFPTPVNRVIDRKSTRLNSSHS
jgi:hypothetical protein